MDAGARGVAETAVRDGCSEGKLQVDADQSLKKCLVKG